MFTGKEALPIKEAMVKAMFNGQQAEAMSGKGLLSILGQGFLNPFVGLGKGIGGVATKAWGGMQTLGTTITAALGMGSGGAAGATASGGMSWLAGGLTGTAAGIAGIATALTTVAVAAGAVVAAYKAWEKYTPSGQLHAARKYAEEM